MRNLRTSAKGCAVYKKDVDFDPKSVRPGPKFKCFMCGEWADNMMYFLHKKWYPFLKYNMNFLCGPKCSVKAYEKYNG